MGVTKSELYTQLSPKSGSIQTDALNKFRHYVPITRFNTIITKDSIKGELARKNKLFTGCLADRVVKKNARKLFAILVYISKPGTIKALLDAGFTDDDLPCQDQENEYLLRSSREPSKEFDPPEDWEPSTIDSFLERQWQLLAPVLDVSGGHLNFHDKTPLPFSKAETIRRVERSVVWKATIHPDHQIGFQVRSRG
jgi:hypothetical protein